MVFSLVALVRAFLFLFQVDDVAGLQRIVLVHFVVAPQLSFAHAHGAAYRGERVAGLGHYVIILVVVADVIGGCGIDHLLGAASAAVAVRLFLPVVLRQSVPFDDFYQGLCIAGVGGISRPLQSVCPSLVVGAAQGKECGVSPAVFQEKGMILIGFGRRFIHAEAVVGPVVATEDVRSCPAHSHLDAEMVVGLLRQHALACAAFQQGLCQCDACRDAVALHLVDGAVLVLTDIGFVGTVLCLRRQRKEQDSQPAQDARSAPRAAVVFGGDMSVVVCLHRLWLWGICVVGMGLGVCYSLAAARCTFLKRSEAKIKLFSRSFCEVATSSLVPSHSLCPS